MYACTTDSGLLGNGLFVADASVTVTLICALRRCGQAMFLDRWSMHSFEICASSQTVWCVQYCTTVSSSLIVAVWAVQFDGMLAALYWYVCLPLEVDVTV
jgi:hypothetical protein